MYSVPYPMLQTLFPYSHIGHMRYLDAEYMFYWAQSEQQVLIRKQIDDTISWILQPNANIAESLAALMGCSADRVLLQEWNLTSGDVLSGDRQRFLDCSWSDYAVDKMSVSFVCRVNPESRFSDSS